MRETRRSRAFAKLNPMKDLYDRLAATGVDAQFLRDAVLPDWWSDDLAEDPANRAIAELAIARQFRLSVADLRHTARPIALSTEGSVRLKRNLRTKEVDVRGVVAVARRSVELVAESLVGFPAFDGQMLASAVRNEILRNSAYVDLGSLLRFCWSHGTPVVHLIRTPTKSKKIDGLATFCNQRPSIVLGSGRDSPPWLAFHLAHELGHIMLAHVKPGGAALADRNLDRNDSDQQEQEADRFACEVLTGKSDPGFKPAYGLTAPKLAQAAWLYGETHRVAPGTVVLIYGRSANRWGPAQKALTHMGQDMGAHAQLIASLRDAVGVNDLPETTARFLSTCAGLAA